MAGVGKKRACLLIMMIFIFQYVMVKMYCGEHAYTSLFNVIFLNFDQMHTYQLNRLSIEIMIPFVFLFHVFYNSQIEFLSINASFLTMYMNKRSKKETIREILIKTGIDQLFYLCICVGMITGLTFLDMCLFERKEELMDIPVFTVYLVRYLLFLYYALICLRMAVLKKVMHFEIMIPYGIFTGMIIFDCVTGIHLITYTNRIINECMYLIGYVLAGNIVMIIMINKFEKGDVV